MGLRTRTKLTLKVFCLAIIAGSSITAHSQESGYDRDNWGVWSDFDGDCQNTRHEVLIKQSSRKPILSDDKCYVRSGYWYDPYTDRIYKDSSDVHIDHIVPLKWAYDHGGKTWTKGQKVRFGNDLQNLLVVDDSENMSKGARGPLEWLPPNEGYHCNYLRYFIIIINKYGLKLSDAEKSQIVGMVSDCNQD